MRLIFALTMTAWFASAVGMPIAAAVEQVPLPQPKPNAAATATAGTAAVAIATSVAAPATVLDLSFGDISPGPSACDRRLAEIAEFSPAPGMVGPGGCGAAGVVRLGAVILRDKTRVPLNPPPVVRCTLAEALAHFVRDEVAPAAADLGAPLAALVNYDAYECRGMNRLAGARLSEHGKANAIDIRAVRLGNGRVIELTDPVAAKEFRERVRAAACGRFNTVLGPGSDSYHESHIHLDLAERSRGHKMCQWDVREPPVVVAVPLPLPRPEALAVDAVNREDEARK